MLACFAGCEVLTACVRRWFQAFHNFDPLRVSKMTEADLAELLKNQGLIRNAAKLRSILKNSHAILKVQEKHGSLAKFLWAFVHDKPIQSGRGDELTTSKESEAMSKALIELGFSFVGPTILYAFMQTCGMVNDHRHGCFRAPRK
eukprot:m.133426 g.133426  ORF g.133426 m.133426 type:complete len:145 (+) comp52411_c0_seq1:331-765(+)